MKYFFKRTASHASTCNGWLDLKLDRCDIYRVVKWLTRGRCGSNFKSMTFKLIIMKVAWPLAVKLFWYRRTPLNLTIEKATLVQVMVTLNNVDPDLYCHMVSLDHNGLISIGGHWMQICIIQGMCYSILELSSSILHHSLHINGLSCDHYRENWFHVNATPTCKTCHHATLP